jgi:predicted MPP superfamily phosphohydrolase
MGRNLGAITRLAPRLEQILYPEGWPFRLRRVIGNRSPVEVAGHSVLLESAAGWPPLKLAFASDFHAGPTTDPAVLRSACAALRAAEPDALLLGGDFVTLAREDADELAAELGEIPAPLGRFAVLGNHDWGSDARYITGRLEASGIEVLTNRNVRLPPPFDQVWICGLDDHWHGHPEAAAALAGADGIRVVLMHAPSGLLDLGDERFDVALCGHTHGGQLALPGGIPIIVPQGALSRRYCRGRFQIGPDRTLLVSVGLGCVILPLRLFARPEIMVCTLMSSSPLPIGAMEGEPGLERGQVGRGPTRV